MSSKGTPDALQAASCLQLGPDAQSQAKADRHRATGANRSNLPGRSRRGQRGVRARTGRQSVTLTWPSVNEITRFNHPSQQLNAAASDLLLLLFVIGIAFASLVVVSPRFGLCIDLLEFQFLRVGLESLHQCKCFLTETQCCFLFFRQTGH